MKKIVIISLLILESFNLAICQVDPIYVLNNSKLLKMSSKGTYFIINNNLYETSRICY